MAGAAAGELEAGDADSPARQPGAPPAGTEARRPSFEAAEALRRASLEADGVSQAAQQAAAAAEAKFLEAESARREVQERSLAAQQSYGQHLLDEARSAKGKVAEAAAAAAPGQPLSQPDEPSTTFSEKLGVARDYALAPARAVSGLAFGATEVVARAGYGVGDAVLGSVQRTTVKAAVGTAALGAAGLVSTPYVAAAGGAAAAATLGRYGLSAVKDLTLAGINLGRRAAASALEGSGPPLSTYARGDDEL